jgi:hypothetical protein
MAAQVPGMSEPQRLSGKSQYVKSAHGGSVGPPQAAPRLELSIEETSGRGGVSGRPPSTPVAASWPEQTMLHSTVCTHEKLPPEQVQVHAEEERPQQEVCP